MHIIFVSREYIPSVRAGGIATYIKEAATSLVENGCKVTIVCASDDTRTSSSKVENGIRVIRLSGGDFYIPTSEPNLFYVKKFRFLYRFFSYRYKIKTVVESLVMSDEQVLIEVPDYGAESLFLLKLPIPVIIRLHTPSFLNRRDKSVHRLTFKNFYKQWIGVVEKHLIQRAKYINSCSLSLKEWIVNNCDLSNQSLIEVIYNPVTFPISSSTKKIQTDKDFNSREVFTVFFAGTIADEKGVLELIEAVGILRKKGVNVCLKLAGKMGDFAYFLKQQTFDKGYHWCSFLGMLSREELNVYYQTSTLCCFPSWWENMPFVCIEAMSHGAIVIGSSNGGMAEIINNTISGFLVEPKNVELLASKIEEVILLPEDVKKDISKRAKEVILDKFSVEVIMRQMSEYYKRILKID